MTRSDEGDLFDAIRVLGVRLHPMTLDRLLEFIADAVRTSERVVVTSQNLHGVYLYHRVGAFRELHEHAVVRLDGMPLVPWARLLGYPLTRSHRVTWVDLLPELVQRASVEHWRLFYLGSTPEIGQEGISALREFAPGVAFGFHQGYFDMRSPRENKAVLDAINKFNPDVLLVGMGMPRQETWILDNRDAVEAPVVMTCGAVVEYFGGGAKVPPRWLGRIGLEWLHRLANDPRRLAKRYLWEPWTVLPLMIRDLLRRT